jgi:polar amino acid transport system substrate-binding protein
MKRSTIVGSLAAALVLAVALAGCSSGGAATKETNTLQKVLARGHLIVGTGSTNVPWHFKNAQGQLEGFDIEMGHILAKSLFGDPSKVEFVQQAPDARIPNLLTNKVDVTIQFMTISPNRLQQVAFSVPYYTEGIGLILNAKGQYKSYAQLVAAKAAGKTINIAVLQNVDAAAVVQEMLAGAKDNQYQDQGLVYQAVDSGRADAGMVDLSSIMWLASKQPDKYIDSGFSAHPQNYGAAMRPNDQIWINFVNGVFTDAMSGATYADYDAAFQKYFGKKLNPPKVGKPGIFNSN